MCLCGYVYLTYMYFNTHKFILIIHTYPRAQSSVERALHELHLLAAIPVSLFPVSVFPSIPFNLLFLSLCHPVCRCVFVSVSVSVAVAVSVSISVSVSVSVSRFQAQSRSRYMAGRTKSIQQVLCSYGVATISRLLKNIGLFCRISSLS